MQTMRRPAAAALTALTALIASPAANAQDAGAPAQGGDQPAGPACGQPAGNGPTPAAPDSSGAAALPPPAPAAPPPPEVSTTIRPRPPTPPGISSVIPGSSAGSSPLQNPERNNAPARTYGPVQTGVPPLPRPPSGQGGDPADGR